ncbi:hypothetical protein TNCV_4968911 [Trichonephila clavipes]|nr:hypothetical protein TNCV_4968911 [Trichonephila clavipes]
MAVTVAPFVCAVDLTRLLFEGRLEACVRGGGDAKRRGEVSTGDTPKGRRCVRDLRGGSRGRVPHGKPATTSDEIQGHRAPFFRPLNHR